MSERAAVLLVLPRADHHSAYGPLLEAIENDSILTAVVVGAPPAGGSRRASVPMSLYLEKDAGRLGWLRFIISREIAARRTIRRIAPALVVVPSDVSDATLQFVEAAKARSIPVVYVQGTQVFPNYVAVNAATEAAASGHRGLLDRTMLRHLKPLLEMFGIHVKVGSEVLGSRSTAVVVTNHTQRDVLVAGGIDPGRIHVLGAPFVDRLVGLRRVHAASATRSASPTVVVLTKHLVRLGLVDVAGQRRIVERILNGIRIGLAGWQIVLKLHPMERAEDYEWVRERWPSVQIVTGGAAEDLLLSCGLAISIGTSSPALAARFLGVPIVIVAGEPPTLVDAHLELFADHQILRPAAAVPAFLRQAVQASTGERRDTDELADGNASMRIIALFHELLRH